ncbi:MAG: MarR family winged helix-turn-helix transcriptional regulator [Alphaproteobacteria bacterium]
MDELGLDPRAATDDGFETGVGRDDRLELRLWLRLLTCTTRIEANVRRRLREEFGITLARFDLMAQLDRAPDGLTMGELSRRLMVSNGNVTGLIGRLVSEGLVERRPAPDDRRTQVVRLNRAGRRAFERMTPVHAGWINEMFARMERRDLMALMDMLHRLKASLPAEDGRARNGSRAS